MRTIIISAPQFTTMLLRLLAFSLAAASLVAAATKLTLSDEERLDAALFTDYNKNVRKSSRDEAAYCTLYNLKLTDGKKYRILSVSTTITTYKNWEYRICA